MYTTGYLFRRPPPNCWTLQVQFPFPSRELLPTIISQVRVCRRPNRRGLSMKRLDSHHRSAFTLIELVVVMAILLFLGALAVYMLPRMQDNVKVSQAAVRLQGWLLSARQRA